MLLHIGLDVGSTTAKIIVMHQSEIVYKNYVRHFSDIQQAVLSLWTEVLNQFHDAEATLCISGSSALALSELSKIDFLQEVVACTKAIRLRIPECDTAIELGGEDAKIIYFTGGIEQRMNNACAGGTGAFIDQMAALLNTDPSGLNELASRHTNIYPIASRCGVFAKTDVQPLINEGAPREDIAASIFQSIVTQTITGLACGRPISGKVAFLGGPLSFLPSLRERFVTTLGLSEGDILFPEDSQYFVALGCCLHSTEQAPFPITEWYNRLRDVDFISNHTEGSGLSPLFSDALELASFRERHSRAIAPRIPLSQYMGPCFLGIDAGSTTTKLVLTGVDNQILHSFYRSNKGDPLGTVREALSDIFNDLHEGCFIANSYVTGYGEGLVKAAFHVDGGEVETMAHYRAASFFLPDVDYILDIGGQDMKAIKIRGGHIDSLMLNEACSAGCGSFLESFAETLGLSISAFAEEALKCITPVDLGSRCTVFMNSKVKQVQKEGASLPDLSAGLSYSVIKNALHKVIKLRNPEEMGERIIVQGGTFLNDAVLRAFENLTGKEVVRPDIAGLMGAYGCALIARERYTGSKPSSLLSKTELNSFSYKVSQARCSLCSNTCAMTINRFPDKSFHVTGNRCERGASGKKVKNELPNLVAYKYERMFNYEPLNPEQAPRGTVGIPRVLNMFENYPFWHTFFTQLGYRVQLSPKSSKKLYEKGMDSIPSEAVCYPAKLAHGHINSLIADGVDFIFYPAVVYEKMEDQAQDNHFNCPVVASYPEVIRTNMNILQQSGIPLISPFLNLDNEYVLRKELQDTFSHISKMEIAAAFQAAWSEAQQAKGDISAKGEETLRYLERTGIKGIVLCGHPYHADPEINHGISELITGMGLAVLTEDSICHLGSVKHPLPVVNQWTYHGRMYRAAYLVSEREDLELVQLTSFGCGIDAITADTIQDILEQHYKTFTLIKVDEISNLGAARIRLRSLLAAMKERESKKLKAHFHNTAITSRVPIFTKEMRSNYTILAPQLSPIHFELFETVFRSSGYRLEVLKSINKGARDEGLKLVNNDACYPAIVTIGQIVAALKSGDYDLNRTAVILTQTGGGCRATNYIALLRKALKESDMAQVPVISLNVSGLDNQPGFKLNLKMINRLIAAACYGDLLMRLLYRTRPYELEIGASELLFRKWMSLCKHSLQYFTFEQYKENIRDMVSDFEGMPLSSVSKPKVGVVGEILIKFHPDANNKIVEIIEAEGGEAVVPDFLDFMFYCLYNPIYRADQWGKNKMLRYVNPMIIHYLERYRSPVKKVLSKSKFLSPPEDIYKLAEKASRLVSIGNQMGEGWFLTAEMMELLDQGVHNIACIQPFACLPNHITGRGMVKGLKELYPEANIVAIDYDAGASEVNQMNRIKLMMSIANGVLC
ncbi:CoA-substrate-specific enzyme activase, putative [Fontibacillus panacisegetis]|uniref:CoA-substrate-specific enzyme activase, putative n=1 Tax=Fontibacillus panacisegetis TaxID=670482 RepID=A0A1G7MSH4_9BACL|nr:2-hydroxyacyl-CoA dehydratase [Fontibacillus panacisegetis]SDF64621.1 CoA-substrate-specific enzyme activase, putative [Fontibacillus panacisegetis]